MESNKYQKWLYPLLILLSAALIYGRSLNYGPVNWDNQLARTDTFGEGLSLGGLKQVLSASQPVREMVTAMLAPWGAKAVWLPYHLVSLAFYLGTVFFFYLTALSLLGRIDRLRGLRYWRWGALAATAIFALHPGHVEVAGWVSGQKDALLGFFYLASFYFYIRSETPSRREIIFSLVLYLLALGSKPTAVTLPLTLALFDWTFRRPWLAEGFLKKRLTLYLAYLFPALAAIVLFLFTSTNLGFDLSFSDLYFRLGKITGAICFSALKLLFPVNLCLRYAGFRFEGLADPGLCLYHAAAGALIYWTYRAFRRDKPWAFFILWGLRALLPNINLTQMSIERADRYYYLSSIGYAGLAGYAVAVVAGNLAGGALIALRALFLSLLVSLGAIAYNQSGYWSDGITAWTRALNLYPDLTLARTGLGASYLRADNFDMALRTYQPLLVGRNPNTEAIKGAADISIRRGQTETAVKLLRLGLRFAPQDQDLVEGLLRIYLNRADADSAEELLSGWLAGQPDSYSGLLNLASLRRRQNRKEEAVQALEKVIQLYPNYPEVYNSLAALRVEAHDTLEAERLLEKALSLGINTKMTRLNLAALYRNSGRETEALEIYSHYGPEELDLKALEFLGAQNFAAGRLDQALDYFLRMVKRDSLMARAYNNAGVVYESLERYREADSMYRKAVELQPDYPDAVFNRGNIFRLLGDNLAALGQYRLADSLFGGADRTVVELLARTSLALGDSIGARKAVARLRQLDSMAARSGTAH